MVLPASHEVPRVSRYSGSCRAVPDVGYGGITRCAAAFQPLRLSLPVPCGSPTTPAAIDDRFGLVPVRSSLLRESLLLSAPPATEMFQFAGLAPTSYGFRCRCPACAGRVAPFGHPRIKACLAAPQGFSQPTASFVACLRQGIHRTPLSA